MLNALDVILKRVEQEFTPCQPLIWNRIEVVQPAGGIKLSDSCHLLVKVRITVGQSFEYCSTRRLTHPIGLSSQAPENLFPIFKILVTNFTKCFRAEISSKQQRFLASCVASTDRSTRARSFTEQMLTEILKQVQ